MPSHQNHPRHFLSPPLFLLLLFFQSAFSQTSPSSSLSSNQEGNVTAEEKPKCERCIPLKNHADGTECQLNQQWGQPDNFLCGPNSGLGCELAKYGNESLPLDVTFEDVNGTAIKPECDFKLVVPLRDESAGFEILIETGKNCTGNQDIFLRVVTPCYQTKQFLYGFSPGHSILSRCTSDGSSEGSTNPQSRMLTVEIVIDVFKYGEIAGAHTRGVVNLFEATCAWIPGKPPSGKILISASTSISNYFFTVILLLVSSTALVLER